MAVYQFEVLGEPAPKGSTRAFLVNGRPIITNANKKTKPWERMVRDAAKEIAPKEPHKGPMRVDIHFYMQRPKTVKRLFHTVKPDLDKLVRSVWDAMTGVIFEDDSQVCSEHAVKEYATDNEPKAIVRVYEI